MGKAVEDFTQQNLESIYEAFPQEVVVENEDNQEYNLTDDENIEIDDDQDQDAIDQSLTEQQQDNINDSVNGISLELTEKPLFHDRHCAVPIEEDLDLENVKEENDNSSSEEDNDGEPENIMDTLPMNEQPKLTASSNHTEGETWDEGHVNLEHYNPLATSEENLARAQTLGRRNVFFTKEFYDYYHPPSEHADLFALSHAHHERSIALYREKFIKEQNIGQELPIPSKQEELSEKQEDGPRVTTDMIEELVKEQESVPLKRKLSIEEMSKEIKSETSQEFVQTPEAKVKKSKPDAGRSQNETTVFDQVLTNMLRAKQPQQQREPSDLEIVAMAAGLESYQQGDRNSQQQQEPTSRYTKQQHRKFLENVAELRRGGKLSKADNTLFQKMCQELKAEKNEFIQYQRKKMLQSGVYDYLDPKVDKMIEAYYELERVRMKEYPQYYKYFNILDMPSSLTADQPILLFKKNLYGSGQIAPCQDKMFDTPRKMDLFKQYLSAPAIDNNHDDEDSYYKKKLPPNLSTDLVIPSLLTQDANNKLDIAISSECLTSFVEMFNDLSKDICIPIIVTNEKTVIFDNPLPKETLTARERNKIVYDWAFKSFCLDWKRRKPVIPNPPKIDTSQNKLKTEDKGSIDWDSELDENLQYNMWAFGDMKILIRHQMDGEYQNKPRLRGTKDKVVCLTTKLDYQISDGAEEMVTPAERASNWIRSYIGGHTTVFEGRIDVVNNRLMRVGKKEMRDIMSDNWRPSFESETLRHIFLKLKKMLSPGSYILRHKPGDRNFLVYQSLSTRESSVDIDLYTMFKEGKPAMGNPENSFIPAWLAPDTYDEKERIAWTLPPK